jgi:hypothetical protein
MTATTPRYGLRHPEKTDPAEAWTAFGQLADDTEDALGGVDDRLATGETTLASLRDQVTALRASKQTGIETLSFTNRNNHTHAVVFDTPYAAEPIVNTNIRSGAGATARWISRAITITPQGFTLFVFSASSGNATWDDILVSWTAEAQSP